MANYPEVIINKYVWKQFQLAKPAIYAQYTSGSASIMPFFPISDTKAGDTAWGNKPYIVFDSFIRPRTANRSFYPIKSAQIIYSVKGTISEIYEWRDFITNVLDREDMSARDVNEFSGTLSGEVNTFFHRINATQINYTGNTTQQTGQRKDYSADLIIKYDYHRTDIYNNS